jgi:hypothetical protein
MRRFLVSLIGLVFVSSALVSAVEGQASWKCRELLGLKRTAFEKVVGQCASSKKEEWQYTQNGKKTQTICCEYPGLSTKKVSVWWDGAFMVRLVIEPKPETKKKDQILTLAGFDGPAIMKEITQTNAPQNDFGKCIKNLPPAYTPNGKSGWQVGFMSFTDDTTMLFFNNKGYY